MVGDRGGTSLIASLFPGYFALVMATGIIAIAAGQQDLHRLADALYLVAAIGYVVLIVLTLARLAGYPRRLFADLFSHEKGFAFLTFIAGTNVLGSATALVHGWWGAAEALWWIGVVLWPPILYAALISVVIRADKPGIATGINGTWFLITVSAESIAALGALILARGGSELLAFVCLAVFLLGLVTYLIVMTLVFLRWVFAPLEPTEADPPAWIAAGAVAITVLAGSNLVEAVETSGFLTRTAPTIEVLVVLAWATATFWFPVMIAIGVWRHVVRRLPLRYHPSYWALVFPLGMYAASTFRMLEIIDLDVLSWLPAAALVLAATTWTLAFAGLAFQALSALRRMKRAT
jgi:tellurite resistance protein TehA-like permease